MNLCKHLMRNTVATCLCLGLVLGGSIVTSAAQTLTVWVGSQAKEYEIVARLFEQKNPGVKVNVEVQAGSQAQITEKITLAIASGAPPDVTWIEGSTVVEFAAQGLLLDVTDAIKGLQFAPADTQEMTYNGRMWAVPYHTAVRGLFKRVDLFDQVGLNANSDPKSLEELFAWSQKLTKVGGDGRYTQAGFVPWTGNWGLPAWCWTFGGQLIEIQSKQIRPTATNRQNIAALEWIANWAKTYGNVTPVTAGTTGFKNGTVAMSAESTSAIDQFSTTVEFTTGRVPNPPGGQNGTWGGGTAVAVPRNSPNPQLALKLARFFGETDVQLERYNALKSSLPSNWQALMTVGHKLPKQWGSLLDQFPEARPRPPLWIEYYLNQLQPAMTKVVAGTIGPEQALLNVQQAMENRYKALFN